MSAYNRRQKHNIRSTKVQLRMLMDYMSSNIAFANTGVGTIKYQEEWDGLRHRLSQQGPDKSVDQWKQTWRDIRRKIRKMNDEVSPTDTENAMSAPGPNNARGVLGNIGESIDEQGSAKNEMRLHSTTDKPMFIKVSASPINYSYQLPNRGTTQCVSSPKSRTSTVKIKVKPMSDDEPSPPAKNEKVFLSAPRTKERGVSVVPKFTEPQQEQIAWLSKISDLLQESNELKRIELDVLKAQYRIKRRKISTTCGLFF